MKTIEDIQYKFINIIEKLAESLEQGLKIEMVIYEDQKKPLLESLKSYMKAKKYDTNRINTQIKIIYK